MDTIRNYLENMFLHLPKTEEVLRAKAELSDMMEDKYYELLKEGKSDNEAVGIVISEFGNLKEISKELGIDGIVNENENSNKYEDMQKVSRKIIKREEAMEYLKASKKFLRSIGIGVFLCICSPILLIWIGGLEETGRYSEDYIEKLAACLGLPFLFVLIAIAVAVFIYQGMKYEKYDYLKKELFSLDFALEKEIRTAYEERKSVFAIKIIVGVILCILSVLPIIILDSVTDSSGSVVTFSVCLLLFMVAIAVFLFITGGGEQGAYHILLQEGEYAESEKRANKITEKIGAFYWPIITCVYLAWSFLTGSWGITWVIWPIAGIVFGIIGSVCKTVENDE